MVPFADPDLEKLYFMAVFFPPSTLPTGGVAAEIQENIDMESYRIREQYAGKISLARGNGQLDPQDLKDHQKPIDELEVLSQIIKELNDRFGTILLMRIGFLFDN